ncbi:cAMP-dependent protein kinase regulatory subunit [Golovinomyces cichoracearum]|uniref:cAMP-dependent protein kinase regulatory subunit n=1 Tax=Golovinomyces cichoracearum TaxID=62708 RepID=A0A420IRK6_9PEZI|nr:cAMP-dependent protein kinase regulatory subunit [Golovinomyces cichoracearum]
MSLPSQYLKEVEALNREVLKAKPVDILQFCANFFDKRLEQERIHFLKNQNRPVTPEDPKSGEIMTDTEISGSTFPGRLSVNPFETAAANSEIDISGSRPNSNVEERNEYKSVPNPSFRFTKNLGDGNFDSAPAFKLSSSDGLPERYEMARRTSVSAESLNPTTSSKNNWTPPFHKKTQEQIERLKISISGNFLFSHLDDEQSSQVLGALVEKPIPVKDIKVVSQGDQGDFFYVVEKGKFDVYVNPAGSIQTGPEGLGNKVATIEPGGSFGELALMYNSPRAATVVSAECSSTLWALDRVTFRRILMDSTFQRRRLYESFLEEVKLLSTLTKYERSKIADALKTQKFPAGTTIIREGDVGEAFYLLESGEAEVFKSGSQNPVKHYQKGDYFGELALLNDAPRAASVVSKTEVKVATLGKNGFQRLLGPVESIMRRTKYEGLEEIDPLHQK